MMRKTAVIAMLGVGPVVGAQGAAQSKPQEMRVTPIFTWPAFTEDDFTNASSGSPGGKLLYYGTRSALRVFDRERKTTRDVVKGEFRYIAASRSGDQLVLLRPAEDAKPNDRNAPLFIWTVPVNPTTGAATGEARRVSVIPAEAATFSPDGKQIAFIARNTPAVGSTPAIPRKMMVIPAAGGQERILFERGGPRSPLQWSPDGKWIYFAQPSQVAGQPSVMSRVSADGGEPTPVTPPVQAVWPGLTPDGEHVMAITKLTSTFVLGLFDLNKQLIRDMAVRIMPNAEPFPLGWTGDGLRASMLLGKATASIHTLNIHDGGSRLLALEASRVPTLSPDGKRVALAGMGDTTLWAVKVMNLDGSGVRNVRDIPMGDLDEALWSPDGKYFAFPSGGSLSVYVGNATNGKSLRVAEAPLHAGVTAWRSDSRAILYQHTEGTATKMQVSIREATVDGVDRLVRDISPLLPPSGEPWYGATWVLNDSLALVIRQGLLVSLRDATSRRLYDPINFAAAGRMFPNMSYDGSWVALPSADRKMVDVLPTDGSPRKTLRLPAGVTLERMTWRQPSLGPLIVATKPSETTPAVIYAVPLDGAAPRALVTLPIGSNFIDITLSADQKTIVYNSISRPIISIEEVDFGLKPPALRRR
jgi:Tol biopolymer transport system component